MMFFHFVQSWTQTVQFLIFSWQISCIILSSHLYLGLPLDRVVRGVQLNIFLTVLESGILCTWSNKLSLRALMWLIIFWCFISLSISSLVLILHNWFSFVGPNIFHRIFLLNINSFWIEDSFNTHDTYHTRIQIMNIVNNRSQTANKRQSSNWEN